MTAILVADDDTDIRDLVAFKLEQAGFEVTAVDNGLAAPTAARQVLPDLVVLDVMMPGMSATVEAVLRDDPSVPVRVRAARSLGRLGTRSAVAPLVGSLAPDRPPALRAAAATALGELGAVSAAPALTGLLDDVAFDVAHEAARSLLRLGGTGRAALVAERDANDRPWAAAHAREALAIAELDERRKHLTTVAG